MDVKCYKTHRSQNIQKSTIAFVQYVEKRKTIKIFKKMLLKDCHYGILLKAEKTNILCGD